MATSQISVIRAAITTVFTTAGLTAFSYPPGDTAGSKSFVYLDEVTADQSHLVFGGSRDESLSVSGVIYTEAPGASATDAKTAEDAALVILAAIEDGLRSSATLTGAAFHAEVSNYRSKPLAGDGNRVHVIEFDLDVEVHI